MSSAVPADSAAYGILFPSIYAPASTKCPMIIPETDEPDLHF